MPGEGSRVSSPFNRLLAQGRHMQVNLNRAVVSPPQVTLAVKNQTLETFSVNSTSISIVSPGEPSA